MNTIYSKLRGASIFLCAAPPPLNPPNLLNPLNLFRTYSKGSTPQGLTLNPEPDNLISLIVNDESHEDEVFVTDILDAVAVAVFAEGGIARFHFIGGVVVGVEAFA